MYIPFEFSKPLRCFSSVVDAGMKVASIADRIYNSRQVLVWTKTCLFVQNNYLKIGYLLGQIFFSNVASFVAL